METARITEELVGVLRAAWCALEPLNLPMAVVGGIAMTAWHRPRATHDVDLLLTIDDPDAATILGQVQDCGFHPLRDPPLMRIGELRLLQLGHVRPGAVAQYRVDMLFADTDFLREALERRRPCVLPWTEDMTIFVVAPDDLILLKLTAGRVIDRADAAALLRANRPEIDAAYLVRWANRLNVDEDLKYIWDEAFPGETPPAA